MGYFLVFCLLSVDNNLILDFQHSPCCECCILSFGWLLIIWILCDDVSEHCSNFIGRDKLWRWRYRVFQKSAHKIQTLGNHPKDRTQQHSYCCEPQSSSFQTSLFNMHHLRAILTCHLELAFNLNSTESSKIFSLETTSLRLFMMLPPGTAHCCMISVVNNTTYNCVSCILINKYN